ncbi:MAG TPA: hypothetical protein VLJ16_04815 [Acidobacteriota bacterium]|nr:hypothetical protein [Acidobacteriota bacterium]
MQFGCTANNGPVPTKGSIQECEILERFLNDPLSTFDEIAGIPDLCRLILNYDLQILAQRNARPGLGPGTKFYVDRLFERNFSDITKDKIRIVIFLCLKLGSCQPDISDRTRAVFNLQPALFVEELEKTKEWKVIVNGISQDWASFSPGLSGIGSSDFAGEVRAYALSKYEAKEKGLSDIAAFINDPIKNFDRIKGFDDIGDLIGDYERRSGHDRLLNDFFSRHFAEISERKIEILIHLIQKSGSGIYGEIFVNWAEEVFCNQPKMFVRVLEGNTDWKEVIYQLAMIGDISRCLEKLGNSPFELEIKAYIEKILRNAKTD